jgi:hypothetical protein
MSVSLRLAMCPGLLLGLLAATHGAAQSEPSPGPQALGAIRPTRPVPRIDGDWWRIAGNPDLGTFTGERQQPVDFAVWQAGDGTW